MEIASLGYRTDVAVLLLGGSQVEEHGDHIVIRTPRNPAFWWGNFLLLRKPPVAAECEAWVDRFVAEFPRATHVALGFDGTSGSVEDLAGFASRGFHVEALAVMTAAAVHQPRNINHDAVYRPLTSDDDWAQSVELRVRCADGRIEPLAYRQYVSQRAASNRRLVEAGKAAWFGAFVGGTLVCQMGLVATGEGDARFQSVETDPHHRRQGLAGTLAWKVGDFGVSRLGAHRLVIVADPGYFAFDLYKSLGFVAAETQLQAELASRPAL